MKFEIFGPFNLTKKANGLVDFTRLSRREFWASVEEEYPGLSGACGCYVLAAKGPQGALPHYVGLASQQSFERECSQNHVLRHIDNAIAGKPRLRPQLFLVAKKTPQGRFARRSRALQKDIEFLEDYLIGLALDRNPKLGNLRGTRFLRGLTVRGFFNASRGARPSASASFSRMIGR